jgi:hypothetical protein
MEPTDRLAYGTKRLAAALDVSERTAWALMTSGAIRSIKIGARRLAPRVEVERYLSSLLDEPDTPARGDLEAV